MGWGEGGAIIATADMETLERMFDYGAWVHRHVHNYGFEVRGFTPAYAAAYSPSAVHSGVINSVRRQRVDESDQWVVSWDEDAYTPSDGTWHTGYS